MDRNRAKSKKIFKSSAGSTGESSCTEMKRRRGREAKRQRVEVVQPTGFETSQEEEEDGSPLQSQLMLSQPLTDSQTSDLEAAAVEGMSSPPVHDLSPLLGANALDALDGWSLGSNLYFSDTGSGGGFLESQASTVEEQHGAASPLLGVRPLRLGRGPSKKVKSKTVSPVSLHSGSVSAKELEPALSQELFEVESLLGLDDAKESSVSQSSLRMLDDKSQGGGDDDDEEEEMVLESVPEDKPKTNVRSRKKVKKVVKTTEDSRHVTGALESSISQSSLRLSDDKCQDGGDHNDQEEEMVLESVPEDKPSRNVKGRKKVKKVIETKEDSPLVADALVSCTKVGIKAAESSQGSSGADLFAGSENLNSISASQSSNNITSPARVVTAARSGGRLRRKKEAVIIQETHFEKENNRSAAKTSQNSDTAKCNNAMSQEKNLEKKDVKSTSKTSRNLDTAKRNALSQEKYPEKKDIKSASKTSQNVDKSKQYNDKKQEKYCKKNNVKSGIKKTSQNVDRFEPIAHVSQKTNSDEESVAKTCSNVNELKSDSQSSVGEVSVELNDEHLKSSEQLHIATMKQNVENLQKSSRLSLKRAGMLARRQKNDQGDIVSLLSSAIVEDTGDRDDTGNNLEVEKKDGKSSNAKSRSAPKKSPVRKSKNEIKRKRGRMAEEAELAYVADLEKPTMRISGEKTMKKTPADDRRTKEADDGRTKEAGDRRAKEAGDVRTKEADDVRTKEADDSRTKADDGRTRSPSLFEYESDSMIAPSVLVTHARKPKRSTDRDDKKCLNRSKQGKMVLTGKTRPGTQLQNSNISQIEALQKSSHLSTSSKSVLTDSGIVATPASFTLASRPGRSKLKTSTPLDQYRSIVGLDKPRRGVKKGKRLSDSGNDSDFILESNLSVLSPVWPSPRVREQGKGRVQFRGDETANRPKKSRAGKLGEDTAKVFSETRPREATTGKSCAKRKKGNDVNEFLPSDEITLEEALKKKDDVETTHTATQIIGTADVKPEGPQKKKVGNRDVVSKEAKARQLHVEERLLQELDDIDQNYSLIIDD